MSLLYDIRYGARTLRNSPGFTLTAIVTLALGIGATTAVFSFCDAILWKPVALPHLDRLAMVLQRVPNNPNGWDDDTPADIADIRRESASFESLAVWEGDPANIVGSGGEPERVNNYQVSANFFDVVGVRPAIGRGFEAGEDQPGRDREVILSDALWRRSYGADPRIVGTTIRLNDRNYLVTGVMPPRFAFPKAAELWTPLGLDPGEWASRTNTPLIAMGVLKPGSTVEQAGAEVDGISRRLDREYPETNKNRRYLVMPVRRFLIGEHVYQYLLMLFGAVLFVLLIACVNVANLQFARATGRTREVAVRTALGASRVRVISQLVTESVLLSLAGATLGLLVAGWGIDLLRAGMPADVEKYVAGWRSMSLDGRALAFTFVAAVLTGILAGLAPAFRCSRPDLTATLKESGPGSSTGRTKHQLRTVLVAAEIALAVVLLVGASLMVRGFHSLVGSGTRVEPATLLTVRLAITTRKYHEPYQQAAFYREVLERTGALPGVRSAVAATYLPYSQHSNERVLTIEGKEPEPGNPPQAMYQSVSANFFGTLRAPLLAGRLLNESDGSDSPRVAVIGACMAQRWWPGEPAPIGKRIRLVKGDAPGATQNPWTTIVGIVGDIQHDVADRVPRPTVYVPFLQAPKPSMDIGIRAAGDPLALVPAVTAAIRSVDPEQPVTGVGTLETLRRNQALGLTYVAVMMAVFGVLALVLAAVGVYGVMAYLVSEQTHEIGIRMALGAPRGTVLTGIFRRGLLTTSAGLAVGLAMAYELARLMASLIFGVTANDPATFVGIPLVLMATAALAIYIPARRAMKIDPIVALRYE